MSATEIARVHDAESRLRLRPHTVQERPENPLPGKWRMPLRELLSEDLIRTLYRLAEQAAKHS